MASHKGRSPGNQPVGPILLANTDGQPEVACTLDTRQETALTIEPVALEQDSVEDRMLAGEKDERRQKRRDVSSCCTKPLLGLKFFKDTLYRHRRGVYRVMKGVVLVLYLAYTCYALYRQWGREAATRLWAVLVLVLLWTTAHPRRRLTRRLGMAVTRRCRGKMNVAWLKTAVRWTLYLFAVAGAVVYVVVEVASTRPANLFSLLGLGSLLAVSVLLSTDPQLINWHTVFWGLALQFYLAVVMLRTEVGMDVFRWLGARIQTLLDSTDKGSAFIFGKDTYTLHPFVFKYMPVMLFVNALIVVAYHIGAVQAFIATFGRFLAFCLGTTPIESVNAAANLFLSLPEASLFVKPFLDTMSESELFAIMAGGFASLAGGIMGVIISIGIPVEHVLAACVMSAPAALAVAKIMCPPRESDGDTPLHDPYNVNIGQSRSLLEAMSQGVTISVTLVATICSNVLIFIAFLDTADNVSVWLGAQAGVTNLSFTRLMSYVFYPLMYVMGVDSEDLLVLSRLVGIKVLLTPLISYIQTTKIIANSNAFNDYRLTANGSWHYEGDDLVLDAWNKTLEGGVMNERSVMMSTYVLCGYGNLGAIAIGIATFAILVPQRMAVVSGLIVRAFIAGNIACFLTGCVAGLVHI